MLSSDAKLGTNFFLHATIELSQIIFQPWQLVVGVVWSKMQLQLEQKSCFLKYDDTFKLDAVMIE